MEREENLEEKEEKEKGVSCMRERTGESEREKGKRIWGAYMP